MTAEFDLSGMTVNDGDWNKVRQNFQVLQSLPLFLSQDNLFVGSGAGSGVSGNYNTMVGSQSGQSDAGSYDVCLGYNAGNDLSSRTDEVNYPSVAIGADSGLGRYAVHIGYQAGMAGGAGGTTFVGYQSGKNCTTYANTGVGDSTLTACTSGNNNTAIGHACSQLLTTGSNNVAVGESAGYGFTTGNSNVILGYSVGKSAYANASNKLLIDNKDTATPFIEGDFSTPALTIRAATTITGNLATNGTLTVDSTSLLKGNVTIGDGTAADFTLTFDGSANDGVITFDESAKWFIFDSTIHTNGGLKVDGDVSSDLIPDSDDTFDLGSAAKNWEVLYSNNVVANSIGTGGLYVTGNSTMSGNLTIQGNVYIDSDGHSLQLGESQDCSIRFDGTRTVFTNPTGSIVNRFTFNHTLLVSPAVYGAPSFQGSSTSQATTDTNNAGIFSNLDFIPSSDHSGYIMNHFCNVRWHYLGSGGNANCDEIINYAANSSAQWSSSGNVAKWNGFQFRPNYTATYTGTIAELVAFSMDTFDTTAVPISVTSCYGLKIDDITSTNIGTAYGVHIGTVTDYAIYTSGGALSFGDNGHFRTDNKYLAFGATNTDLRLYSNGTQGVISTNDDLDISCGTNKTLELQETVYKDINLGGGQLSQPASSPPGTDNFLDSGGGDTGVTTYAFAVGEKLHGEVEVQHDYKEGTNLTPHVHWQGITAPAGGTDNVQWQLTYTISRDGQALQSTSTTTGESAITAQYQMVRTDMTAIDGSTAGHGAGNIQIGDQIIFTLERIAASSDEYSGDALLATFGFHYEVNTLGSRQIGTK